MKKFKSTKEMLDIMNQSNEGFTRLNLKMLGFEADRRTLRQLERQGFLTKKENFARNTAKTDGKGKAQNGTRFYTYFTVKEGIR